MTDRTNALWSIGIIGCVALVVIVGVVWSVQYGSIRVRLATILRKVGQPALPWLDPAYSPARGGDDDQ